MVQELAAADMSTQQSPQTMRIVHVTNYQVPGYGYEEIQLAQAQQRLGHQVWIVTSNYLHPRGLYSVLNQRFPHRKVAPREENQGGVGVLRLSSVEIGKRVWIHGLENCVRRLRPDIVHCHNLLQFHPPRLARLKGRIQPTFGLLVDDHMHRSVMRRTPAGRLFYRVYRAAVLPLFSRSVDRYCAISEETRDYLVAECGVRSPIDVMPLGVDVDAFHASTDARDRLRRRLGWSDDDLVFLYTGKLIAAKGPHLLVAAALRLLDAGHRLKLLLVGDADDAYVAAMTHEINRAGRAEDFLFLPSVPQAELPEIYAAADAAVWPRQESMALLEAMSSSLPVIVSAAGGYAPLVESGVGLTFLADDVQSLADQLTRLESRTLRAQLGARGRAAVERDYSWKRSAERYLQAYRQLLERVRSA